MRVESKWARRRQPAKYIPMSPIKWSNLLYQYIIHVCSIKQKAKTKCDAKLYLYSLENVNTFDITTPFYVYLNVSMKEKKEEENL